MPRLRPGRNQLNIINVSDEIMQEFENLRKGAGPGGLNVPRWQLFETIFKEWKEYARPKDQPKVKRFPGRVFEDVSLRKEPMPKHPKK